MIVTIMPMNVISTIFFYLTNKQVSCLARGCDGKNLTVTQLAEKDQVETLKSMWAVFQS